jgi:hypothetical protein
MSAATGAVLAGKDALEYAAGLESYLAKAAAEPGAADSADGWAAVRAGEWDLLGSLGAGRGAQGRRDLLEFAVVTGRTLPGLPLATTWVLRTDEEAPADRSALSLAVPRRRSPGTARIPFGGRGHVEIVNLPWDVPQTVPAKAPLAPSLPLAEVSAVPQRVDVAVLDTVCLLWAGECLGAAAAALATAVEYAGVREQFGRAIGSFQAIKHMLAEAQVALEVGRSAAVWAANEPGRTADAVRLVGDRALFVTEVAGQVHGGIGMTWELGLHWSVRHVLTVRDVVEDALAWRPALTDTEEGPWS